MTSPLSEHSANKLNPLSQHSANGRMKPERVQLGQAVFVSRTDAVTTESILRSRISELEAEVENLKAQLREAKK